MDFSLTEQQRLFADTVAAFARKELADGGLARAHNAEFPHDVARKMASAGLLGITIPETDGGSGGTLMDAVLAIEQIALYCPRSADVIAESELRRREGTRAFRQRQPETALSRSHAHQRVRARLADDRLAVRRELAREVVVGHGVLALAFRIEHARMERFAARQRDRDRTRATSRVDRLALLVDVRVRRLYEPLHVRAIQACGEEHVRRDAGHGAGSFDRAGSVAELLQA